MRFASTLCSTSIVQASRFIGTRISNAVGESARTTLTVVNREVARNLTSR